MSGKVYLVGAGPGAPGLLTLRGRDVLGLADVVVYDHLANARLLDHAPNSAEFVRAGKSIGHCELTQEQIQDVLIDRATAGKTVVRLKGGDPFVFGRGAEEVEALVAAGIPFEVVPGVTAGVGATAFAGLPVTHRDCASGVAFVTGHGDPESPNGRLDWAALAKFPGTLVFYMGVTRLAAICRTLIRHGMPADTPAATVRWGSLPAQQTITSTLEHLPDDALYKGLGPPALLVVGPIVAKRDIQSWYEKLPLFGQRIVVTRPEGESDRSASILEALGAEVLVAPTVQILPIDDWAPVDQAIDRISTYDWLVFTSGNGVRAFLDRLPATGRDLRALGRTKLAAIGPATAEALASFRLTADLVPPSYRSEDLADELLSRIGPDSRILLARADRGRTILKDRLKAVAEVDQVAVYRNADAESLPEEIAARIDEGSVDWITLTSSAITERLHGLISENGRARIASGAIRLASISPVTSAAARRLGWDVSAEAEAFTWDGVVRAIITRTNPKA